MGTLTSPETPRIQQALAVAHLEGLVVAARPRLMLMRWLTLCAFLLIMVTPTLAFAEVMDKEPAPSEIWTWAICGGAAAGVAWSVRAWLGALATAALAPFFVSLWSEISDPFVGPAIRAEAGTAYVTTATRATVVATALVLCGVLRCFLRARRANGATRDPT